MQTAERAVSPPHAPQILAASYNVHGFVGIDGRFDPARTFRVIEALRADFVALQEVHRLPGTRAGNGLEELAAMAGFQLLLGPTLERDEGEYGNALLTRIAMGEVRRHDLSVPGREPRGALEARLDRGDVTLRVVATHLGLRAAERRVQVSRLAQRIDAGPGGNEPDLTVLLGDFNEWRPRGLLLAPLARRVGPLSRRATFPSRLPCLALDRIGVRPTAALVSIRAMRSPLARRASDHLPLVARLRVG